MNVNETVYCAVNKSGEVQLVSFKTDNYLRKVVAYHNSHANDKWLVSVCTLKETIRYIPSGNINIEVPHE